jgi:flagellar biosynthesis protein FlhF
MSEAADSTIRFIAKSAQEAAAIVRSRLGPAGRVISVEQVMESGLKRFVSSPRLEIVATKSAVALQSVPDIAELPTSGLLDKAPGGSALSTSNASISGKAKISCRSLLTRACFSSRLMARLDGAERWREICELPAAEGLPQAIAWLRQYRAKPEPLAENTRLAFVGCPGVGKTTALCKYLARELFLYERKPQVLQLEVDKPHMDSGLSIYCDILGVPCFDDPSQVSGNGTLLIDVPGVSPLAKVHQKHLRAALDAIGSNDRVLVLNAAYEEALLERHAEVGRCLGAKYRVYTHLDELEGVSKLWGGVMDPDCSTLFFSNGQNVVGNLIEDSFGYLIERTFPL